MFRNHSAYSFFAVAQVVLALSLPMAALAQSEGRGPDTPAVPANIEVPDGYALFFKAHAVGSQNYVCLPTASGASWGFVGPQATLFDSVRGQIRQQLTTHFLSSNPAENGVPRPTWQHSFDSSRVWGKAIASSSDVNFVEAGAIPWLLLQAIGTASGPTGGFVLTQTAFIHRVNTSGGIAPATGCSSANIGAVALVPYSADYLFYRAQRDN